jgi:hypothetical protein
MSRRRQPGLPGVSPLRGGSFAASFGRGPYVRGGCRARRPRHRPHPVPAATPPDFARHELVTTVRQRVRCAGRRAKGQLTDPPCRALPGSAPPPASLTRHVSGGRSNSGISLALGGMPEVRIRLWTGEGARVDSSKASREGRPGTSS